MIESLTFDTVALCPSGVCQGCPVSPFLFGIVMIVLMHDAYSMLSMTAQKVCRNHRLYDILYADDTLLLGIGARNVEELASAIEKVGS